MLRVVAIYRMLPGLQPAVARSQAAVVLVVMREGSVRMSGHSPYFTRRRILGQVLGPGFFLGSVLASDTTVGIATSTYV